MTIYFYREYYYGLEVEIFKRVDTKQLFFWHINCCLCAKQLSLYFIFVTSILRTYFTD